MKGKRQSVMAMAILLVCSTVVFYDIETAEAYTSPGADLTISLTWLAQTSAVSQGQEQGVFFMTEDVTISGTDTLNIAAGEHLYISPNITLTINGNWNVNGQQNNKAYITTSNGEHTSSTNIDFNNNTVDSNTFDIDYLDLTKCSMELSNSLGVTANIECRLLCDKDYVDSYSWTFTGPPTVFAVGSSYVFSPSLTESHLDPNTDADSDGIPKWWEERNGYSDGSILDASYDDDGDGLTTLEEYNQRTNPRVADTDGDGLDDGDEVEGNVGTHGYTSDPLDADTDDEGLLDGHEVDTGPFNPYETNPNLADTDSDSIEDDIEEEATMTDPTKYDTDDDDIGDSRDPEPNDFNRKFAFIFEVNEYGIIDRTWDSYEVANRLDEIGWDVYLYTDKDYTGDLNDDVEDNYESYASCTWDVFVNSAWDDFKDQPNAQNPVGTEPAGYGTDIVFIYMAADGMKKVGSPTIFQMRFPNTPTDDWKDESTIQGVLDDLGSIVDVVWINSDESYQWNNEIGSSDGLSAVDRVVILSDGSVDHDSDTFIELFSDHYNDLEKGIEDLFDGLDTHDDNFKKTDQYQDDCYLE